MKSSRKMLVEDTVADADAEIDMLVGMGFSHDQAKGTLNATGGDVNTAIDYLTSGQPLKEAESSGAVGKTKYSKGTPSRDGAPPPKPSNRQRAVESAGTRLYTPSLGMMATSNESLTENRQVQPRLNPRVARSIAPGAEAVPGPDYSVGESDTFTLTPSEPSQTGHVEAIVTAKIAHHDDDDYERLQTELEQRNRELDRINRDRENVVVAEVLPNHEEAESNGVENARATKRRKKAIAFAGVIILVVAVIAVIVGVTVPAAAPTEESPTESAAPTPSPTFPDTLLGLLSSVSFDGGEALQTQGSPQYRAYDWLLGNTNLDSYSDKRKIQRYALATFYYSTNGDSWRNNTGWLSDIDECDWYNAARASSCQAGAIYELDFWYNPDNLRIYGNNLVGKVPPELALLSNSLVHIKFGSNNLTGSIPSELGLLTELDRLWMQANRLTGSIPSEIGLMVNLEWLNLSDNDLGRMIPSEFGLLKNLEYLNMGYNILSGVLPSEIGSLSLLGSLVLYSNRFNATIPSEIGLLEYTQALYLSDNRLTGTLPSQIALMTSLETLFLRRNTLIGTIPSEMFQMTNMGTLYLGDNILTGTIPSEIGQMTNLGTLYLDAMSLTGTIPSEIGQMTNLGELYLDENSLTGTIPTYFALLTSLKMLSLRDNSFSGEFTCPEFIERCDISCRNFGDDVEDPCRSL